jgi:hypothetical protein
LDEPAVFGSRIAHLYGGQTPGNLNGIIGELPVREHFSGVIEGEDTQYAFSEMGGHVKNDDVPVCLRFAGASAAV